MSEEQAALERAREIQARLDAASEAPWMTAIDDSGTSFAVKSYAHFEFGRYVAAVDHELSRPDAQLIAHAPDDLAWLLEALRTARAETAAVREALRTLAIREHWNFRGGPGDYKWIECSLCHGSGAGFETHSEECVLYVDEFSVQAQKEAGDGGQ